MYLQQIGWLVGFGSPSSTFGSKLKGRRIAPTGWGVPLEENCDLETNSSLLESRLNSAWFALIVCSWGWPHNLCQMGLALGQVSESTFWEKEVFPVIAGGVGGFCSFPCWFKKTMTTGFLYFFPRDLSKWRAQHRYPPPPKKKNTNAHPPPPPPPLGNVRLLPGLRAGASQRLLRQSHQTGLAGTQPRVLAQPVG